MHDGPDESERGDDTARELAGVPERSADWPAERDAHARLQDIDDAPLEEHVEVYEDVHRRLQEGLADLDEA